MLFYLTFEMKCKYTVKTISKPTYKPEKIKLREHVCMKRNKVKWS